MSTKDALVQRRQAPLATPSDLEAEQKRDIVAALNLLLADVFTLYLKTKNFHWHMSGPHFRDYTYCSTSRQISSLRAPTPSLSAFAKLAVSPFVRLGRSPASPG